MRKWVGAMEESVNSWTDSALSRPSRQLEQCSIPPHHDSGGTLVARNDSTRSPA